MFYAWILIFFWLQLKLHWHCFWSIILYLLVEHFCVDLARHFRIKLKLSLYFYFAIKSVRDWNAVSHFFSLRLVPFRQPLSSFNTEKALSLKHTKQKKKQKKTMKKFRFIMNTKMKNGQMTLLKTLLSMEIFLRTNNVHSDSIKFERRERAKKIEETYKLSELHFPSFPLYIINNIMI